MLANIALPSFLPHSFATLVGLFVIAGIEGWFVMRIVRVGYAESYRHALSANLMSTLIGIPFAWVLWIVGLIPISMGLSALGLEAHPAVVSTFMQTAVFGGMMPTEWMHVGGAVAWMVMLIPFWMGSVWMERQVMIKRLPDREDSKITKAVVCGNLASYSIFLIFGLVALANALIELPDQKARYEEFRENQERLKKRTGEQDGDKSAILQSKDE